MGDLSFRKSRQILRVPPLEGPYSYPTAIPTPLTEPIGMLCTWTWQRRGVAFARVCDTKVDSDGAVEVSISSKLLA